MDYEIIRSRRKTVAIQITPDRRVLVRCPMRAPEAEIRRFVESKKAWIAKHLQAMAPLPPPFSDQQIADLTQRAKAWFPQRTAFWAERMGLQYGRVTIRHQRSCWGSCSAKKNLNFNCLLMLAPKETADYVIVHELCHLVHPNHSKAFWALVERTMPDYAAHRQWLKEHGRQLIGRLPQNR